MTVNSFFQLATDARTLRFSFVRNPYARAVSLWADKFRGKPLVAGDMFIDKYLARRREIDSRLPVGAGQFLSFADFVIFLAAVAKIRCDVHTQTQDDILSMPGITLDFVGKLETYHQDFARVLDHLNASDTVRELATSSVMNRSSYGPWAELYTDDSADRIYRAYECDFDRFEYPRALVRA